MATGPPGFFGGPPPWVTAGWTGGPPFSIPSVVTATVTELPSTSMSSPSQSSPSVSSPSGSSPSVVTVFSTIIQPSTSSTVPVESASETPPPGSYFGTRTILGPLTTTFTPAARCATPSFGDWNSAAQTPGGYNYGFGYQCYAQADPDCFPQGFVYEQLPVEYPMYTPAAACPDSWAPACSASRIDDFNAAGDSFLTNWLKVGEQVQVCCPSGWSCGSSSRGGQLYQHCFTSYAQSTGAITGFACGGLGSSAVPVTSTYSDAAISASFGFAPGIALLTASPTAVSSPSSQPQAQNSSGLSSGAQAGIGVGVALGVLLLVALGGLIWYLRVYKRRNSTKNRAELEANTIQSREEKKVPLVPEMQGSSIVELDATPKPGELETPIDLDQKIDYEKLAEKS